MNFKEFYESGESKFKSDKGTLHDYVDGFYHTEFTDKKNENLKILEIGVFNGASLKLWKDWFVNSEVIGIDPGRETNVFEEIINEINQNPKTKLIKEDAYTEFVLNMFEDNSFDYIIDDGPHSLQSQIYSVRHWFKKIKPGGKLIIEDVQSVSDLNQLIIEANETEGEWEVIDLRNNKQRYDDILLVIKK